MWRRMLRISRSEKKANFSICQHVAKGKETLKGKSLAARRGTQNRIKDAVKKHKENSDVVKEWPCEAFVSEPVADELLASIFEDLVFTPNYGTGEVKAAYILQSINSKYIMSSELPGDNGPTNTGGCVGRDGSRQVI
ncbi:hypothetical protein LSAT2_015781 [Lamellibrachia satsuma]|nr:hypothetical protein LSAT2_015781 [Lamellibrachia satsuma]